MDFNKNKSDTSTITATPIVPVKNTVTGDISRINFPFFFFRVIQMFSSNLIPPKIKGVLGLN
jgi:hypothetical protein